MPRSAQERRGDRPRDACADDQDVPPVRSTGGGMPSRWSPARSGRREHAPPARGDGPCGRCRRRSRSAPPTRRSPGGTGSRSGSVRAERPADGARGRRMADLLGDRPVRGHLAVRDLRGLLEDVLAIPWISRRSTGSSNRPSGLEVLVELPSPGVRALGRRRIRGEISGRSVRGALEYSSLRTRPPPARGGSRRRTAPRSVSSPSRRRRRAARRPRPLGQRIRGCPRRSASALPASRFRSLRSSDQLPQLLDALGHVRPGGLLLDPISSAISAYGRSSACRWTTATRWRGGSARDRVPELVVGGRVGRRCRALRAVRPSGPQACAAGDGRSPCATRSAGSTGPAAPRGSRADTRAAPPGTSPGSSRPRRSGPTATVRNR